MLGLGVSASKGGLATPGIVTDSLVLKHNYAAGGVSLVSDGAAFFDGTDDYILVADASNLSFGDSSNDSAFSISAWVNMTDATSFPIISKGLYNSTGEYQFGVDSSDKLCLEFYDESVDDTLEKSCTTAVVTAYEGVWTHICATYNGVGGTSANAGIIIYINGVSQALSLSGAGTYVAMENLAANVHIGRYSGAYAGGYICNVGVWSAALTQAQIKSIMWKNYAGLDSTTNLVSWWNLSANANDDHGSHNGTLT